MHTGNTIYTFFSAMMTKFFFWAFQMLVMKVRFSIIVLLFIRTRSSLALLTHHFCLPYHTAGFVSLKDQD